MARTTGFVSSDTRGESLFTAVGSQGDRLHLRRIQPLSGAVEHAPLLLVHGAVANGRIFYSDTGRGLAPFLARHGFDVFVADLRGRGQSFPPVSRASHHGQLESIIEDLPVLSAAVASYSGRPWQHWVAHSWGGVLMASCLVRFPEIRKKVLSLTCFGTKRNVAVRSVAKFIGIDLVWDRIAAIAAVAFGYVPGRLLMIGSDNEPRHWHAQCRAWVDPRCPWVDPVDGFNYAAAATANPLPRTWHLAGGADPFLGHPDDVRRFAAECGHGQASVTVLCRENGFRHDYDHVSMLIHPDALDDHFPAVANWLRGVPGV